MDFYIYILYSPTFDKYYIGHSEDPWRRIEEHNSGKLHKFTSDYRPWRLAAVFRAGEDRSSAMKIEKLIKKQKSRKLIEKLLDPDFVPKKCLAQLVRVPYVREERKRSKDRFFVFIPLSINLRKIFWLQVFLTILPNESDFRIK